MWSVNKREQTTDEEECDKLFVCENVKIKKNTT